MINNSSSPYDNGIHNYSTDTNVIINKSKRKKSDVVYKQYIVKIPTYIAKEMNLNEKNKAKCTIYYPKDKSSNKMKLIIEINKNVDVMNHE